MSFPALPVIVRRSFFSAQTRPFSNSTLSALRERLSGRTGSESARLELKWMREELRTRQRAAASATSLPSLKWNDLDWEVGELEKMVDRRLQGEPLQYILGRYGTALPSGLVFGASTNCVGVTEDWLSLKQQRVAYITLPRNQPFGPITIKTRAPTLIPRPETEDWTIRLGSLLEDRFPVKDGGERTTVLRMLDLCTGTGCIPILLSHLRRQAGGITVAYGVDISTDAVSLARENATDQSLTPSSGLNCIVPHDDDPEAGAEVVGTGEFDGRTNRSRGRVGLNAASAANGGGRSALVMMHADILREEFVQVVHSRMEPPFDVITSNPPYIPLDEYEGLPNSVKEWEDQRALLGDPPADGSRDCSEGRGLMFYHRIAQIVSADGVLASNGVVALEVGHTQAEWVREILAETGRVSATEVWKDPWGVPRVVVGYR